MKRIANKKYYLSREEQFDNFVQTGQCYHL